MSQNIENAAEIISKPVTLFTRLDVFFFFFFLVNAKHGEKARQELHNACCFEQILEAAPLKTAAVQPLPISKTIQEICAGHGWQCFPIDTILRTCKSND